jgi:WD40 repeat protein
VSSLSFSPDGSRFAALRNYGPTSEVLLWDMKTYPPKAVAVWHLPGPSYAGILSAAGFRLAFSPDGRYLAAGVDNGAVYLFLVPRPDGL